MNMMELREQFGLPKLGKKTSDVGKRFSNIIGRKIPVWIIELIENTLYAVPTNTDKCFIDIGTGELQSGHKSNKSKSGVYQDNFVAISKYFNRIGIGVATYAKGPGRNPNYRSGIKYTKTCCDPFHVGEIQEEGNCKVVLQCEDLYENMYKLLYEYIDFCVKTFTEVVIPFKLSNYVTQYNMHVKHVSDERESEIAELVNKINSTRRKISEGKEYFSGTSNPVRLLLRKPSVTISDKVKLLRFDIEIGDALYSYSDTNVLSSSIALDSDLFHSINPESLIYVCRRIYEEKVDAMSKYVDAGSFDKNVMTVEICDEDSDALDTNASKIEEVSVQLDGLSYVTVNGLTGEGYINSLENQLEKYTTELNVLRSKSIEYGNEDTYPDSITWFPRVEAV